MQVLPWTDISALEVDVHQIDCPGCAIGLNVEIKMLMSFPAA